MMGGQELHPCIGNLFFLAMLGEAQLFHAALLGVETSIVKIR